MRSPIKYYDFDMLLAEDTAVVLDKELILNDNLDGNSLADLESSANQFRSSPVKVSFTLVIICIEGSLSFRLNQRRYTMQPNDLTIALSGDIGELIDITNDTKVVIIGSVGISDQIQNNTEAAMNVLKQIKKKPVFSLTAEEIKEIMIIYRSMKKKLSDRDNPFRRAIVLSYMQALIYTAYSILANQQLIMEEQSIQGRAQQIFDEFIKLVQTNYKKERSINFYANQLCITPKYMAQVIYKVSGHYAKKWITDYVISEIKILLRNQNYSIQQIAEQMNFENPSFFTKYFKSAVGYSPKEYRTYIERL